MLRIVTALPLWPEVADRVSLWQHPADPARQSDGSIMTTAQPAPAQPAPAEATPTPAGLGTFAGVFTPSILTILGIILFLRLGFVVGAAGLAEALLVIAAANLVSVLTSLSLAAIATNLRVKGGGDYYLISRTLGLGFGGAIGLVLFFAQAISVGFYCIGFAEAVAAMLGSDSGLTVRLLAGGAVAALFVLAWLGADWATKFQYVVMAAIILAIAAFAIGAFGSWDRSLLVDNWARPEGGLPFWAAFAIFFPAVTGFTQGVSMSGDLKSPGRSIPAGVLSAVALSIVVYFGCALLFAGALPNAVLAGDYGAMRQLAAFGPLIDAGVIAATLSSALASFLGAPRILQSLAADQIFPLLRPFAAGHGSGNNPRRGVLLTLAVAALVVVLGDLNLIAGLVSMFFLLSYGLLNYATYYEARAQSPSFRPGFRFFHKHASLAGALFCLGAMLAIDITAGLVAGAIVFGIYQYLRLQEVEAGWADSRRSHHLRAARDHLLAAARMAEHARDWRPQLLVFSNTARRRARVLRFASWVEGGSGLTTVVRVLQGYGRDMLDRRAEALEELTAELKDSKATAFPLVVSAADLDQAIATVIQASGTGPLRVNTVIANWLDPESGMRLTPLGLQRFSQNLRTAFRLGCNLLLLDADAREWEGLSDLPAEQRVIDVWWRPNQTGELMLLLAYLITRSDDWAGSAVRLLAVPRQDDTAEETAATLQEMLAEIRIDAEIVVVPEADAATLTATSGGSSLVFLPFSFRKGRFYSIGGEVDGILDALPIVVMALAGQDVDLDADPDEVEEAGEEEAEEEAEAAETPGNADGAAAPDKHGD